MTEKQFQQKLDRFVALGNELVDEAKKRFGRESWLFHEADGTVYVMDGDGDSVKDRQEYIKIRSTNSARWGAGAW